MTRLDHWLDILPTNEINLQVRKFVGNRMDTGSVDNFASVVSEDFEGHTVTDIFGYADESAP